VTRNGFGSFVAAFTCAFVASALRAADQGHLHALELRCEYLRSPLAVEEPKPRLTWIVNADRRDERQSAYRILAASTLEGLNAQQGDLWDSGKEVSNATSNIEYGGKQLASRQECYWKVQTFDRDGNAGEWSAPAHWEMGLLSGADWDSSWLEVPGVATQIEITRAVYHAADGSESKDVTESVRALITRGERVTVENAALGGDPAVNKHKLLDIDYRIDGVQLHANAPEHAVVRLGQRSLPYLRNTFSTHGRVAKARLYATALGIYELYLNGKRIDDQELAPGWTDYRVRTQYQAFDVTSAISEGKNTLGAIVGPGWFSGRAGLFRIEHFYGTVPALKVQLELTYADGSTQRITPSKGWMQHAGPTLSADLMDGVIYDARRERAGWSAATVNDDPADPWIPAATRNEARPLHSQIDEPVRVIEELKSLAVTEPAPGRWTFDLGQNMVGVIQLQLAQKAGTAVTIRHGEMLNPDGTLYTENLRGAAATDVYICRGGGQETWTPSFTTHGFRYVELTGISGTPSLDTVKGIVMSSALTTTGTFSCSDASINQLQANIVRGLRGNYVSIPTDCPQRDERMGWMADTQVFAPTAAFNVDAAPFMSKWMLDVDDALRSDGAYSDVSPATKGLSYGTPAWADAGTIVPWTIYQMYGDTRILERHIDSMKKWVDWCKANSTGLIRDHARGNDYGDWLSIDADTSKDLIGTAYFAHSAQIVAESLTVLGRVEEAKAYSALFEDIRKAFISRYVDADGHVGNRTQCCYVLAMRFDLLPPELRSKAAALLVDDIEARQWHLSTGFVGVGMLLPVLTDAGRSDVAYRLLMQDTFPSWLFSVKHGATTIWERWNGWTPEVGVHPDASMNSFNHYSLGSCGQWLFESVAGISPDPKHPGFERFTIRPRMDGPISGANGRFQSIHGLITSQFTCGDTGSVLRVTIPANTTATVYVPAERDSTITESGNDIKSVEGVRELGREGGHVVLSVGSGSYEFKLRTLNK